MHVLYNKCNIISILYKTFTAILINFALLTILFCNQILTFPFSTIFAALITKSNIMKRIVTLITVLALGSALSANAQDPIMSKKGTPIVYEAGDWGIGIDAMPFLYYAGNMLNGNTDNSAPSWNYQNQPMVISGFMINDVNSAFRGKLGINFGSTTTVNIVPAIPDPTGTATVEDEVKSSSNSIVLGFGIQKMRGKGRLHGFYGAEALIGFGGSKVENTFGNPLSINNLGPRTTENKAGSTFMFGVRGFIGAEYFFAPKISIAGEFGWGPMLNSTGEGEMTSEVAVVNPNDPNAVIITSTTTKTGKASSFNLGVDRNNGSIRATFYF